MNNVLIVGNGFDRQLGLKTDYISFLDWVEEKGEYVEHEFNSFLKRGSFFKDINETNYFELINNAISNVTLKKKSESSRNLPDYNNALRILDILKNNKTSYVKPVDKKHNLWFSYFNYLRKENTGLSFQFKEDVGKNGEWINLETLIERNIISKLNQKHGHDNRAGHTIYSFTNIVLEEKLSEIQLNKKLWEDFKELKKLLTTYLEWQNPTFQNNFHSISVLFLLDKIEFNKVINFNYTYFFEKLQSEKINKTNNLIPTTFYNVHGNTRKKERIVFGFDSFFKDETIQQELGGKSTLENKLLVNKDLVKYTKISQLLELQKDEPKFEIGVVDKLYILGHSIGEQDYNYFFSIMDNNIENIEIIYLWYKYNSNPNFDNKQSGQDALFNMINAYEKYANKRVFHKMIFEGRIKFKEVFISNIV